MAVSVNPNLYLKFDASVTGSAHLECKYNYANWFKAGIRYEGNWKTFSDFEEQENDFVMTKPTLTFSAGAGVGLYLAADVMIYDVAGPEVGVGPSSTRSPTTHVPLVWTMAMATPIAVGTNGGSMCRPWPACWSNCLT